MFPRTVTFNKNSRSHVITIDFFGIKNIFGDDINMDSLPTKFQVLKTIAI